MIAPEEGAPSPMKATPGRRAAPVPGRVGEYAGFVSRLLAFGVDIIVALGTFALAVSLVSWVVGVIAGHTSTSIGTG